MPPDNSPQNTTTRSSEEPERDASHHTAQVEILGLQDIHYQADGAGKRKPLFESLNLSLFQGDRAVLLGVNGSGKSTLLRILNGLYRPNRGKVFYRGQALHRLVLKKQQQKIAFRRAVGLLFQSPDTMMFNTTVREEIAFGPRAFRVPEDVIAEQVERTAHRLGVTHLLESAPYHLSGGEKKRVALAALLVNEPEVLLLDEPLAGLDPPVVDDLLDILESLSVTTLTATHDVFRARAMGSRAIVLCPDHRICYDGPVGEFLDSDERMHRAGLRYRRDRTDPGRAGS